MKIDQITHGVYFPYHLIEEMEGVLDGIEDITHALMAEEVLSCGITGYTLPSDEGGDAYLMRLGIKYGKQLLGRLFVCPLSGYGNLPYVRIDTYTAKIQRLELVKVYQAYLNAVISSAVIPYVYETRVSLLDFAFDAMANPQGILWFGVGLRSHFAYAGQTSTWYLGGKKSAYRFRIYNKKIQLLNLPIPLAMAQPYMLRAELSLGNGKGIPSGNPVKLKQVKNPWLRIHPINVADIPSVIKECQDPTELAKAVEMGLHAYLKTFGTSKRQSYSKKLRMLAAPSWWKPEAIWLECLKRVDDTPFVSKI